MCSTLKVIWTDSAAEQSVRFEARPAGGVTTPQPAGSIHAKRAWASRQRSYIDSMTGSEHHARSTLAPPLSTFALPFHSSPSFTSLTRRRRSDACSRRPTLC